MPTATEARSRAPAVTLGYHTKSKVCGQGRMNMDHSVTIHCQDSFKSNAKITCLRGTEQL